VRLDGTLDPATAVRCRRLLLSLVATILARFPWDCMKPSNLKHSTPLFAGGGVFYVLTIFETRFVRLRRRGTPITRLTTVNSD
jgi:hypothetical protein